MTIEILTGLLVLITGFYAWATFHILKANERVVEVMKSQSEAMTRPYLTVTPFIEVGSPVFCLKIKNTGKTAANRLRLSLDKDFYRFGEKGKDKNLAELPAFCNEIDALNPNEEITFSLALAPAFFNEKADESLTPSQFTVTARYSFGEKTFEEAHMVDLRSYFMADVPQDIHAKELKDIRTEIAKVADAILKITDQKRDG